MNTTVAILVIRAVKTLHYYPATKKALELTLKSSDVFSALPGLRAPANATQFQR